MTPPDWKSLIPEPPQAAPSTPAVEPAPVEPPRVVDAEPPPIDNTDAEYWERKATPAEIARAEAFLIAEERRARRT